MRVIVGAGVIGGYFGGRMLQAGRDITFLVLLRPASELAAAGLVIKSPNGDVTLKDPPVVQADTKDKFVVVLLNCKAYDLDGGGQHLRGKSARSSHKHVMHRKIWLC